MIVYASLYRSIKNGELVVHALFQYAGDPPIYEGGQDGEIDKSLFAEMLSCFACMT